MGKEGDRRGRTEAARCRRAGHERTTEEDAPRRSQPGQTLSPTHRRVSRRALREIAMDHPLPIRQFLHDGDFLSVLKAHGYEIAPRFAEAAAKFQQEMGKGSIATEGATVLAVKYKDGVLVAGDRRATAGNLVMYERAEKLINIDERSVLAIAGVPAVAFEMARTECVS